MQATSPNPFGTTNREFPPVLHTSSKQKMDVEYQKIQHCSCGGPSSKIYIYIYIYYRKALHRNNVGFFGTLHPFFALRKYVIQGKLPIFVSKGLGEVACILMSLGYNLIQFRFPWAHFSYLWDRLWHLWGTFLLTSLHFGVLLGLHEQLFHGLDDKKFKGSNQVSFFSK